MRAAGAGQLGALALIATACVLTSNPSLGATDSSRAAPAGTVGGATRFNLDEIRIEGNTLLPATEIEAAVYPFLGPDRTADDIEQARVALDALYNKRGFPTVSAEIPRQRVTDGVVTLKVTERSVGRLRVTGSRYFSLDAIRNRAPSLAEGRVPNIHRVEQDIQALNRQPGRSVTPVLQAGRAPGTVDVDLVVSDKFPAHGSIELNNRTSAGTTALRLSGAVGYDNLWQRGDSVSAFFQVAPQRPKDALVFSTSYLFHIPDTNLSLLASYLKSDSNVTSVGSTNVIGKGQILGARLLIPLTSDGFFSQTLSVGIDYKDFEQNLTLAGTGSSVPLQYYPAIATYQANWTGDGQQTDLTGNFVFGPRGIGSGNAVFDQNRYRALPNFYYVRAALAHTHDLPHEVQFWARAQTQISPDLIVANEQFSVGGQDAVRGYYESEVLGDNGASLQMEMRSPSLATAFGLPAVNELRFYAFSDLGYAAINNPLPEQRRSYALNSAGVGVRLRLFDRFSGALESATALTDGPTTKTGTNRVLFRLFGDF